jgi:hypothetical protein
LIGERRWSLPAFVWSARGVAECLLAGSSARRGARAASGRRRGVEIDPPPLQSFRQKGR